MSDPKSSKSPKTEGAKATGRARFGSAKSSGAKKAPSPKNSGNPAKRDAASTPAKIDRKTPVKPKRIGNRWAAPAMLTCAVIGLAWIVVFYTAGEKIPVMKDLDSWNLVIGMGFIVAAFGFSMKWE